MSRFPYVGTTLDSGINLANAYTSPSIDTRHLKVMGITCICTGSPSGTFAVQYSVDNVTFYPLLDSAGAPAELALGGSAENLQFTLVDLPFGFVRLSYTAGGTGSATIVYGAKGGQ